MDGCGQGVPRLPGREAGAGDVRQRREAVMRILYRRLLLVIAFYTLVIWALGVFTGKALAHDGYDQWRAPDNPATSCCNDADCRPARAYLGEDGHWRAWTGERWLP